MAGEKARITNEIIERIEKHTHEDTVVYLEAYKKELNEMIQQYDLNQANALKQRLLKKEQDSKQEMRHHNAEQNWKLQTSLREVKAKKLDEIKEAVFKGLQQKLDSEDYLKYLELAKNKAPKEGVFLIREKDAAHFEGLQTKFVDLELGGFKVDDGQRVLDFTLKSAYKEVFESFSKSLNIDEQG